MLHISDADAGKSGMSDMDGAWVRLRPGIRVGPEVEDGRTRCVYVQDTTSRRMFRFDAETGAFLRQAYGPDAAAIPWRTAIDSLTLSGDHARRGEHALAALRQMGILDVDDTPPASAGGPSAGSGQGRLRLIGRSGMLASAVRHMRWLWGPAGLVLATLAIIVVIGAVSLDV